MKVGTDRCQPFISKLSANITQRHLTRLSENCPLPTASVTSIRNEELTQSWRRTVEIIKSFFSNNREIIRELERWTVLYEYPIPRREKRIDAVLLSSRAIYVAEFEVGQEKYLPADISARLKIIALNFETSILKAETGQLFPFYCAPKDQMKTARSSMSKVV